MPLQIIRNDITKIEADAIVNAANESLLGGGGVDGAIHQAAGPELLEECRQLNGCRTGDAKVTGAYRLPAKYIIHTVGPIWKDGRHGEPELLASCYRSSLELAAAKDCTSIAFPLIATGVYGYPKDAALQIAVQTIGSFLLEHDLTVYLVIFDKKALQISSRLFADIREYIDDRYVEEHRETESTILQRQQYWASCSEEERMPSPDSPMRSRRRNDAAPIAAPQAAPQEALSSADAAADHQKAAPEKALKKSFGFGKPDLQSLDDALQQLDESFSQMVLRKIDEAGIKDSTCYKRANMDRKLFSKIRSNPLYRPSKQTAIALGIALELSLPELQDLLAKAGYALSHSSKFDIIIEYFVQNQNYDIFEINETLFLFDQPMLG